MQRIFLIGPPGSGKTAVGQVLAEMLGCAFFDTDQLIESKVNLTISQIFAEFGEAHFRALERQLLEDIAALSEVSVAHCVYATGGGLPVYNNNLVRLQQLGKVVLLNADISILVERLRGNRQRPLLAAPGESSADEQLHRRISELVATRGPMYEQAGYKIDTTGLNPAQVANEIVRILDCNR